MPKKHGPNAPEQSSSRKIPKSAFGSQAEHQIPPSQHCGLVIPNSKRNETEPLRGVATKLIEISQGLAVQEQTRAVGHTL